MTEPIIIGIDTGNRCIKTCSFSFIAGIKCFDREPPFKNGLIVYNGKYYMLSDDRVAYLQDKTQSEEYFVLALFAIVKELEKRGVDLTGTVPVRLGVGLPPSHISRLAGRFKEYFNRGVVVFEYDGRTISLDIQLVQVFAQGYAAIYMDFNDICRFNTSYIIDIGGYTTDIISLHNGRIDPDFCESIDMGLIQLYNRVAWKIHSKYGHKPLESQIDDMIAAGTEPVPDMPVLDIVNAEATTYIAQLLRKLAEFGIDLKFSTGIFVGGGSERFRKWIAESDFVSDPYFILNVYANAQGYESLLKAKCGLT